MNIDLDKIQKSGAPEFTFAEETKTIGNFVAVLIPYIFGAAGILLFLYLIWGGFSYMTSQGDPKATEAARKRITYAIVGFVIVFTAYWLVQILGFTLGIEQFEEVFGK